VHRSRPVVLLALLAVVLGGCRLGVRAEVEVERDGSGTASIVFELDRALLAELDELGVDPTAELTAAAARAPGWELTRRSADGDLTVTLSRDATEPGTLADAFEELTGGLAEADPALLIDLDLAVDEDGASTLGGTAQLRPPIGPGVVLDDPDALAAFEEQVADTVDASLTVTLPGPVEEDDADRREGRTLTWDLEPGEERTVTATASAPPWWEEAWVWAAAAGALGALLVAALLWWWLRRRRSRRGGPVDAAPG
jgi:hypothetical protein